MSELSPLTRKARETALHAAQKCLKASLAMTVAEVGADSALKFSEDAGTDEIMRVLKHLIELERTNSVVVRFAIGDVWNLLGCNEGKHGKRMQLMHKLLGDGEMFDKECCRFRQYGWICTKWPSSRRRYDRSWSWLRCNKPDFGTKSSIIKTPSTPRAIAANYIYTAVPGVALDVQIDLHGYTVHVTDTAGNDIPIVISMQNANKAWRSEVRLSEGAHLEVEESKVA
jgi:hypothetical protein